MIIILATLWVTTMCNLKCSYCYEGQNKQNIIMDRETADQSLVFLFNKAKSLNKTSIKLFFHGGEPLLNYEIIRYVMDKIRSDEEYQKYDIRFGMTTNGTLFTEEIYNFISKYMDNITISIDGCKETHDLNRKDKSGNGTYSRAIYVAQNLQKERKNIRIRMTITSKTVDDLFNNVKFLIDSGFKEVVPALDYEDIFWNINNMDTLYSQLKKIKKLVEEINDPQLYVSMIREDGIFKMGECKGGVDSFHIYSDGKLYPCVYAVGNSQLCCGDVWGNTNKKAFNLLKELNKHDILICLDCSYYDFCISHRCKIINYKLTNDFFSPSL